MPKFKNIPVFEMEMDEDAEGIYAISFVDRPAIREKFVFLSEDGKESAPILMQDEEERMVYSPALIPEQFIYRNDEELGEHYIKWSANSIKETRNRMMRDQNTKAFNLMHQEGEYFEGVYTVETWLKGKKQDKANELGFKSLPQGTLMVGIKVENDEVWEKIKTGEVAGISIEGRFAQKQKLAEQPKRLKYKTMLLNTILKLAKKAGVSLEDIPYILADGSEIILDSETGEVFTMVEGVRGEALADGEYTLEDGTIWVVTEGKIPMEADAEMSAETAYEIEGVGKVTERDGVLVNEAGEPLSRGIYNYDGGQLVVTENGFEVFEASEEPTETPEETAPETAPETAELMAQMAKQIATQNAELAKLRQHVGGDTKLSKQAKTVNTEKVLTKEDFIKMYS